MHIENIEIVDFTLAPFLLRARDTSGNLQEEIEEICINVRCISYFLEILQGGINFLGQTFSLISSILLEVLKCLIAHMKVHEFSFSKWYNNLL